MRLLNALFSSPPTIQPQAAEAAIAQGAQVIDVREPAEFSGGAIPGAVNVPLGRLRTDGDAALREVGVNGGPGAPVIFVCRSGVRSRSACKAMSGFLGSRAVNLVGGMSWWSANGLDMARGSRPAA